jgi:hypothetical protein
MYDIEHIHVRLNIPKNRRSSHCESRLVRELVNRGLSLHNSRHFTHRTVWACTCWTLLKRNFFRTQDSLPAFSFFYTSVESADLYLFLSHVTLNSICKFKFILSIGRIPCMYVAKSNVPRIRITRPYWQDTVCSITYFLVPWNSIVIQNLNHKNPQNFPYSFRF